MTTSFWYSSGTEAPIAIPALGVVARVRLPAPVSDGAVTVLDMIIAPNAGLPPHRFRHAGVFRVLSGCCRFTVDGLRTDAKAGDIVHVPRTAARSFTNAWDAPCELSIYVVPGMDMSGILNALAEATSNGLDDKAKLDALSARWFIEFLPPDPMDPDEDD